MNPPPVLNKPVAAIAYLRRLPGMDDAAVRQTIRRLQTFADRRGLALIGAHCERRPGERLATWAGLILGCRDEGITTVVVPSSHHFHQHPEIASFMREELEERIHGVVWYANVVVPANVTTNTGGGRRER
jgi:hypothetical protein